MISKGLGSTSIFKSKLAKIMQDTTGMYVLDSKKVWFLLNFNRLNDGGKPSVSAIL